MHEVLETSSVTPVAALLKALSPTLMTCGFAHVPGWEVGAGVPLTVPKWTAVSHTARAEMAAAPRIISRRRSSPPVRFLLVSDHRPNPSTCRPAVRLSVCDKTVSLCCLGA